MCDPGRPDPALRAAGLSATGRTAEDLQVGEPRAGTAYDDPGGPGTAYRESTSGQPDADVEQPSEDSDGE